MISRTLIPPDWPSENKRKDLLFRVTPPASVPCLFLPDIRVHACLPPLPSSPPQKLHCFTFYIIVSLSVAVSGPRTQATRHRKQYRDAESLDTYLEK